MFMKDHHSYVDNAISSYKKSAWRILALERDQFESKISAKLAQRFINFAGQ